MNKKYISVDIEASGLTPGKYSMLSLGACIVGDARKNFYRELKPLNKNYILEAMKIGCLGLKCLEPYKRVPKLNPKNSKFSPLRVLEILAEEGEEPKKVMSDFAEWILGKTKGFRAIEAATPIKFDGMFTTWYFDNFYDGENPLGFSGEDMNSFYRGVVRDRYAHLDGIIPDKRKRPHNALDDAIQQAKEFKQVLKMIGR